MNWLVVLVALISGLTGSGVASIIRAVLSGRKVRAEAEATLSDSALELLAAVRADAAAQIQAARDEAKAQVESARQDVRSARHEAVEARNEAAEARSEATAARREVLAAVAELRALHTAILSPTATMAGLRELVDPGSANGGGPMHALTTL